MATLGSNGHLQSTDFSFLHQGDQKSKTDKCAPLEAVPAPLAGCASLYRKTREGPPLRAKKRPVEIATDRTVADLQKRQLSTSSTSCADLKSSVFPTEATAAAKKKKRKFFVEPLADPETETRPRERMRYDAQLAQAAEPLLEEEADRQFYSEQGRFDSFKTFFRYHAQKRAPISNQRRRRRSAGSTQNGQPRTCTVFDGATDCMGEVFSRSMCVSHYFEHRRKEKMSRKSKTCCKKVGCDD